MNTPIAHSPEWQRFRHHHGLVAIILALLLLLLWLSGFGPGGRACPLAAMEGVCTPAADERKPPVAAAPASAAAPVAKAEPPVASAPAMVKLYFARDQASLPVGADEQLGRIVAYLKTHPQSVAALSGYHDPSGNLMRNQQLALERARAVRDALELAGIANERVQMHKPASTTGDGPPDEARRVEVSILQP